MNVEKIVQENVDFYNQRDIDGFMSKISQKIEVFQFGSTSPSMVGHEQVRAMYSTLFADSPKLHSTIMQRIVYGNTVIDHEHIAGRQGSTELVEMVLIYEVEQDLIRKITVLKH